MSFVTLDLDLVDAGAVSVLALDPNNGAAADGVERGALRLLGLGAGGLPAFGVAADQA